MEEKHLKELEVFKVRLLSLNKNKTLAPEVYKTVHKLITPSGYLSKEAQVIFDIDSLRMVESEKMKLIGEFHQLNTIVGHALTIMRKSTAGRDFEKQVDFIIKKIKNLPERWHDGVLNQLNQSDN